MSESQLPKTNIITLTRHVLTEQQRHKDATGELTLLLTAIQLGCKFLSTNVRRAGLINLTGFIGSQNVQGEEQKKLDVLANDIFINSLVSSGKTAVLVSEENEEAIIVDAGNRGKYCVVFDPLDGSSNIECGVSIGTIFGIYHIKPDSEGTIADVLRPGREMVCAGYCMYGSSTQMVLSLGNGVNGYTLDTLQVPKRGKIYSINEGNMQYWDAAVTKYINGVKNAKSPYSARYIGSMVADVHRTLLYGGIFAYPTDSKSPNGKLRLLYECFPMAFLIEQAGGRATTGHGAILDIVPTKIHQRSGIFLGSKDDVEDLEAAYKSLEKN